MSKYKIQMCTPDLWNLVRNFYIQNWEYSGKRLTTYLDWLHPQNPYLEEPLIYVALYEGRVVGMRAAIGTCWEAGDYKEKLVLPNITDSGIEAEHQNSGLFGELSDYVMNDLSARGYSHALNLSPNPPNYVTSIMTMGWLPLGSSETMSRAESYKPAVENVLQAASRRSFAGRCLGFGIKAARKVNKAIHSNLFSELDRNVRRSSLPISLSKQSRPQAMADLIQQLGGDGRIRHVRDEAYFSWRFLNPYFRYRFLFWGKEDLDGYIVLHYLDGLRAVNIIQWEGRNQQVRSDLLHAAVNLGRFRTLHAWGISLSASDIETLVQAGFSYADDSPVQYKRQNFMLKPLAPVTENKNILGRDPLIVDNWDLQTIFYK